MRKRKRASRNLPITDFLAKRQRDSLTGIVAGMVKLADSLNAGSCVNSFTTKQLPGWRIRLTAERVAAHGRH